MNESSDLGGSRIGEQLRMLATIAEQVDRLEAENRHLSEERDRLRGALTDVEARLGQVSSERDQLAEALATARHELALFAERESAWRAEATQTAEALRELADRLASVPTPSRTAAPSPPPAAPEEPAQPEPAPAATTPAATTVATTDEAAEATSAPVASDGDEPTPAPPELVAPAESPPVSETYELAASPFSSFSTLIAFQKAVAGLPGVEDVRTKSFLNGALILSLRYRGRDPLTASLARLPGFRAERLSAIGNRIEFVVATEPAPR